MLLNRHEETMKRVIDSICANLLRAMDSFSGSLWSNLTLILIARAFPDKPTQILHFVFYAFVLSWVLQMTTDFIRHMHKKITPYIEDGELFSHSNKEPPSEDELDKVGMHAEQTLTPPSRFAAT